jgi:hypothetical protein
MSRPGRLLIVSGLALALWGMSFGLYYALFVEHQTLDRIGGALAMTFAHAADDRVEESRASLDAYASAQYDYVRAVDVHSHWIGLAMLLIVFGAVLDRVAFSERRKYVLAVALVTGSAIFPAGVFLQTMMSGPAPRAVAAVGAALVTIALIVVAFGLTRRGADAQSREPVE